MPLKSKAETRFMFKFHPDIAKEFAAETPNIKALPERVHSPKTKSPKSSSPRALAVLGTPGRRRKTT